MNLINSQELINVFTLLNKNQSEYILLRNINNELPNGLEVGKDIDILVNKKDESKFINFFALNKYETINHPFKYDIFLYGVDKFEFKYNNNNNILFDLNFQLAVRSLDAGQWIPLDETIQISAWKNRRFEQVSEDFGYWTLSYDDEFICLVARSIFDKKEFQIGYINRIDELFLLIDKEKVIEKLNMIFFKFTPYLLELIETKSYSQIIKNYLEFKEY